jgi:hypothetical protein
MNILNGLDEMGLAQNKIDGFRFFDCDSLNVQRLHPCFFGCNAIWCFDQLPLSLGDSECRFVPPGDPCAVYKYFPRLDTPLRSV